MALRRQTDYTGVVVEAFSRVDEAERAVRDLLDRGFTQDEISVVAQDRERAERVSNDTGADVAEGAGIGAATGGVLGGIAGAILGATAVAIPGIGIVVAGPLVAILGGAGAGAIGGGLAGVLAALGVSETDAERYRERYEAGDILVVVAAGERERLARSILSRSPI